MNELDGAGPSASLNFATISFLDPGILYHGQIDMADPPTQVPAHILALLGDMDAILETASNFFGHIHSWMPFISKKRFYEQHMRSFQTRPEVALMLLALRLLRTLPPKIPRNARLLCT